MKESPLAGARGAEFFHRFSAGGRGNSGLTPEMKRGTFQLLSCLLGGLLATLSVNCTGVREAKLEKTGEPATLLPYRLDSLTGVRDGDLMKSRLVFTSESARLVVEMNFRIGVPTVLDSGRYTWEQQGPTTEGSVIAASVTFLGGQSDGPSIGGVFQLLGSDLAPQYRIILPTTVVARPARK